MGQNASLHLNYGDPGNKGAGKNRESCQECNSKNRWELTRPLRSFNRPAIDAAPETHVDPQTSYREHVSGSLASHPSKRLFFSLHIHHIHLTLDISLRVTHSRAQLSTRSKLCTLWRLPSAKAWLSASGRLSVISGICIASTLRSNSSSLSRLQWLWSNTYMVIHGNHLYQNVTLISWQWELPL